MLFSAHDVRYVTAQDTSGCLLLDGVCLEVGAGEVVDISGPSGAGKTTLLRAFARLLPGACGRLRLSGTDADAMTPGEWRSRVALLPQKAIMRPGTVAENIRLPWALKVRHDMTPPTDDALRAALDSVSLGDIALDRSASRLSVGQAARVALLRVVLTAPDVLLLDEPDANLDDDSAAQVAEMTRRFAAAGGAVVRVRHQRADGIPSRRMRLSGGSLEEVAAHGE